MYQELLNFIMNTVFSILLSLFDGNITNLLDFFSNIFGG